MKKISNDKKKSIQQSEELIKSVIGEIDAPYDKIVIYLTKENGDVLVKGAMNYSDIAAMEKLHSALPHEIVGMLYSTLESQLKEKAYEQIESTQNEQN